MKVALIACMRKLISILNIMIERRQKWDVKRYAVELIERTARSVQDRARMAALKTRERTGSRPSAAEGGGAQRQPWGRPITGLRKIQLLPGVSGFIASVASRKTGLSAPGRADLPSARLDANR